MAATSNLHADPALSQAAHELALEGFAGAGMPRHAGQEKYVWLRETGSRLWLDTGDAASADRAWSPELEALTTNNTLVNQVVQTGVMDQVIAGASEKIRKLSPGIPDRDLIIEIAFLVNAKLALSLVQKFGAHVSVELHPDLSSDIEGTIAFARRYFAICPDNFYIKVPLTPDGFVAVRRLSKEKIPVNFTIGFSARQNYLAARFSRPRFVNVFLGRLNSFVEENHVGEPGNVGEKAALASDEIIKDVRASSPDVATEQIAASIRNGRQVADLAGIDVLTIPPKSAEEYLALDVTKEDVALRDWRDLDVHIESAGFEQLWMVDQEFVAFVEDVLKNADHIESGRDLVELSHKHGVNLFRDWSTDDLHKIREKGKIPDLSQWPGVPIDDLMSVSALESFAKDQEALDERIKGLIG